MKGKVLWYPLWFEVLLRLAHAGVLAYGAWLLYARFHDPLTAGAFAVLSVLVILGIPLLRPTRLVDLEEGTHFSLQVRKK